MNFHVPLDNYWTNDENQGMKGHVNTLPPSAYTPEVPMVDLECRTAPDFVARAVVVNMAAQVLLLHLPDGQTLQFPVSTSSRGPGNQVGSGCTPTGRFFVAHKIGEGFPSGTIFKSRQPVGHWLPEEPTLDATDLVLTRILWLAGAEPENANTLDRYIYIHGTNHEELIGQAVSHGCIRMKNSDVLVVFDALDVGDSVWIMADVNPP